MSTSQLCRATNQAIDDLQRAYPNLAAVLEDLEDGMSGLGASKWDTDTGVRASGGSVSDPTGEHALNENSDRERYKRISRHIKTLAAAADGLLTEVASHQARTDTKEDRREVDKANQRDEPGCTICARSDKWVVIHQPEKGRPLGPTDYDGALDRKVQPCTWHHKFILKMRRLPNEYEETRHQEGRRVTYRVDHAPPRDAPLTDLKGIGEQTEKLIRNIDVLAATVTPDTAGQGG